MLDKIPAITGPTGSGKSETAFYLAKRINGEIINADSQSVYKYFNIGTSKPSRRMRGEIRHYLVGTNSPEKQFTAGDFVISAGKIIDGILRRGKVPVICGGTGLYITALKDGISTLPVSPEIRKKVAKKSHIQLLRELKEIDRTTYERIDRNNPRRVVRAVEIYYLTGLTPSQAIKEKFVPGRNVKVFFLDVPREKLYVKIDNRVYDMFRKGLVREVKSILRRGIPETAPPFGSIGYREVLDFIAGKTGLEASAEKIKIRTRHLAKRQFTWWKKRDFVKIDSYNKSAKEVAEEIRKILYNKSRRGCYENSCDKRAEYGQDG